MSVFDEIRDTLFAPIPAPPELSDYCAWCGCQQYLHDASVGFCRGCKSCSGFFGSVGHA